MMSEPEEKWADGTTPDDQTRDVAVRALRRRLDAVLYWLRQAARHAEKDIEHIHHLRVWSRRATAAIRLYWELLPRRRASWIKKSSSGSAVRPMTPAIATSWPGRLAKRSDQGARRRSKPSGRTASRPRTPSLPFTSA